MKNENVEKGPNIETHDEGDAVDVKRHLIVKKINESRFKWNKKYLTICIYAFFLILAIAIVVLSIVNLNETKRALYRFIQSISPFLFAILIAYLIYPLMRKIEYLLKRFLFKKKRWKGLRKGISIFVAYAIVIGFFILSLLYVFPQIINSIQDLTLKLPGMYDRVYDFIVNLEENVEMPFVNFEYIRKRILEMEPQLLNSLTNFASNLLPFLWNLSYGIVKLIINIVLSIVISCYMMFDKENLTKNLKRLIYAVLRKDHAESFCQTGKECNKIFSGFLIGKTIDSLIIGVLCFIAMSVLRMPYAILISIFVGITNMIPYFGPFIGGIAGVMIYLLIRPRDALIFAILILILQQFDGLYLGPKILGDSTGLKPLWVIFAITVGGAYFGVLGMFLGVPVVAVLSFLVNTFIKAKLAKKGLGDL